MTTEQLKIKADGWYMALNISGFLAICSMSLCYFVPILMIVSMIFTFSIVLCGVKANDWNEKYLDSL